jgi:hypothetical protein
MPQYIFHGRVLPERAQVNLQIGEVVYGSHEAPSLRLSVNIFVNQVAAFATTDDEDIFTLRNFVHDFISGHLSVLGFTHGHAYDLEITRVLTPNMSTDYIFGIEMPCIAQQQERRAEVLSPEVLGRLTMENHGHYLRRFFTDFTLAMKHAIDTGFYCYRALEALRQHCAATTGLEATRDNKAAQWELFRSTSQTSREDFLPITTAAEVVRHGGVENITDEQRQRLLVATWTIAEKYLRHAVQHMAIYPEQAPLLTAENS